MFLRLQYEPHSLPFGSCPLLILWWSPVHISAYSLCTAASQYMPTLVYQPVMIKDVIKEGVSKAFAAGVGGRYCPWFIIEVTPRGPLHAWLHSILLARVRCARAQLCEGAEIKGNVSSYAQASWGEGISSGKERIALNQKPLSYAKVNLYWINILMSTEPVYFSIHTMPQPYYTHVFIFRNLLLQTYFNTNW